MSRPSSYGADPADLDGGAAPFPFDLDGRYRVDGGPAVAWKATGYDAEADADTEWTGLYQPTGRIVAVMVGDDRPETFDPLDLIRLDPLDYCDECGQIGCRHDGRERDTDAG